MGLITKNGVPNFSAKLQVASKDLPQQCANKIAEEGVEIATQLYDGKAIVSANFGTGGNSEIIAKGKGIMFQEYGTGTRGEGTYDESKLPSQTFEFESPQGVPRKTDGWVYNYMKKLYYPNKEDVEGHPAGRQMLDTSLALRQKYAKNIEE